MEQRSNYVDVGSKGVQVKLDGEEECARAILGYAQMRHYSCHHAREHLGIIRAQSNTMISLCHCKP